MKVGVNLINFGPSAAPETLLRWAALTEDLGFHSLMTSDHIAVTPDVGERYPGPLYEPLTTFAWLAAVTRRVLIGSTVIILPYRSPLETARAIAGIDRLSGGRPSRSGRPPSSPLGKRRQGCNDSRKFATVQAMLLIARTLSAGPSRPGVSPGAGLPSRNVSGSTLGNWTCKICVGLENRGRIGQ